MSAAGTGRLTILLHAGMHKTGTTSIQRTLCAADLRVADGRCGYLRLDAPNFSGAYIALFRSNAVDHMSNWLHGRTAADVAARRADLAQRFGTQLATAAANATTTALLISAEALSLPTDGGALPRFRAALLPWCRDIQVQAYVRAPISFMESHFLQRVKASRETVLDPHELWPQYRARFERLDQVFGPDAVALAHFSPGRFPNGDAVKDLMRRLRITATDIDATDPLHENRGLSLEAAALLFVMRRSALLDPSHADAIHAAMALAGAMSRIGAQRLRFAAALIAPVLDGAAADLRWMEDRLGRSLAEPVTQDGIRGTADLLDIAAASRGLLDQLDAVTLPAVHGIPLTPRLLQTLLDEGLAA